MYICWGHKPGWDLPFREWPARAILYGSNTRGIEVTKAGCPLRAFHHLTWVTLRPVFFLSLPPVFSGFAHSSAANSQFSLGEWRSWEDLSLGIMTNLPIPKLIELGSDHLSLNWLNFCAEKINPKKLRVCAPWQPLSTLCLADQWILANFCLEVFSKPNKFIIENQIHPETSSWALLHHRACSELFQ